ncbi:MAG: Anaphase-promoting complex subunit 5 [Chaenotheca gracillima]|nr:MAG: Anaphase-promoting complex subunit 5 [Chaenotheca gracillima]
MAQDAKMCYFPDGATVDTKGFACNTTSTESTCCGERDACMTGGYCYSQYTGYFYRRSCTDKTWKAKDCAPSCQSVNQDASVPILQCDHSYNACCAEDGHSCCNNATTFFFDPGFIKVPNLTSPTASGSSSSPSAKSSSKPIDPAGPDPPSPSSPSPASPSPATPTPVPASADHKPLIVGVAVGVPLGLAFLAVLALLLYRERKSRRVAEAALAANGASDQKATTASSPDRAPSYQPHELQNPTKPMHELSASQRAPELDSNRSYM